MPTPGVTRWLACPSAFAWSFAGSARRRGAATIFRAGIRLASGSKDEMRARFVLRASTGNSMSKESNESRAWSFDAARLARSAFLAAAVGAWLGLACDGGGGGGDPLEVFIAALDRGADARCACVMTPAESCSSAKSSLHDCLRQAVPAGSVPPFPSCAGAMVNQYNACVSRDGECVDRVIVAPECDRALEAAQESCQLPPAAQSCLGGGGTVPGSSPPGSAPTAADAGTLPGNGVMIPGRPPMTERRRARCPRRIRRARAARTSANSRATALAMTADQAPNSTFAPSEPIATTAAPATAKPHLLAVSPTPTRAARAARTSANSPAMAPATTAGRALRSTFARSAPTATTAGHAEAISAQRACRRVAAPAAGTLPPTAITARPAPCGPREKRSRRPPATGTRPPPGRTAAARCVDGASR
jgi:hypothetical protein